MADKEFKPFVPAETEMAELTVKAVLLGAITGAMTSGAALSTVNAAARSSVPALGYTGAYAFANVILTIAGTLIVRL